MKIVDYTHPELNEEVMAISGHYLFQKESRLDLNGKEILYHSGYSVTDSSCCGVGGCVFSYVAGFIKRWQYKTDVNGKPITEVELIDDEKMKQKITTEIKKKEISTQVNFLY